MNAAARDIHQSNFFHGQLAEMRLSVTQCLQLGLLLLVLLSSLAVVYMTNLYRMTLNQLEASEQQGHQLQLQWGQLLLEQASYATPARVQQLAGSKLHMLLPSDKHTFVLRLQ